MLERPGCSERGASKVPTIPADGLVSNFHADGTNCCKVPVPGYQYFAARLRGVMMDALRRFVVVRCTEYVRTVGIVNAATRVGTRLGTARSNAAQPPARRCHDPTSGFRGVDAGVPSNCQAVKTVCLFRRLSGSRVETQQKLQGRYEMERRRRCRSREWAAAHPVPADPVDGEGPLPCAIDWPTELHSALLSFQVDLDTETTWRRINKLADLLR